MKKISLLIIFLCLLNNINYAQKDTLVLLGLSQNDDCTNLYFTNKNFSFNELFVYGRSFDKESLKMFASYVKNKTVLEVTYFDGETVNTITPVEDDNINKFFAESFPGIVFDKSYSVKENIAGYFNKYISDNNIPIDLYKKYAVNYSSPVEIDTIISACREIYFEYTCEKNCKTCDKDYPCLNYDNLQYGCAGRADFISNILDKKYGIQSFKLFLNGGFYHRGGKWFDHVAVVVRAKESTKVRYRVIDFTEGNWGPQILKTYMHNLTQGNCGDSIDCNPYYFTYCLIAHSFLVKPIKVDIKTQNCECVETYKIPGNKLDLMIRRNEFSPISETEKDCMGHFIRTRPKE